MKKLLLSLVMVLGMMVVPVSISNAVPVSAPLTFAQTDGDVLTGVMVDTPSGRAIAIGGNFRTVIEPSGARVAAKNLAVISQATGKVLYAGNVDGFVRALTYYADKLYIGGSFTKIGATLRKNLGVIYTTTWALHPMNPGSAGIVTSLAVGAAIYVGTSGSIKSMSSVGVPGWTVNVSGGPIQAILTSPDKTKIFVGGLFDSVGTLKQHGLFQLNTSGVNNAAFKPVLRPNTHVGEKGTYDGMEVISLAWEAQNPATPTLLVGGAGAIDNIFAKVQISDGRFYWLNNSPGDVQGLAVLGDGTFIFGYHRNHGNNVPLPFGFYGTQANLHLGELMPWTPKLSGGFYKFPDQASPDGGNGGIQEIVNDTATRKLYVLGAFTKWNQTCNLDPAAWPNACVNNAGTKNIQSIAVYSY